MKCLLVAINAKYIHSNPAIYILKACADQEEIEGLTVEIAEYTINHHASEIFDDIYLRKPDVVCFSCYIWNIEYVRVLVRDWKCICPEIPVWLGGPEVSYDCRKVLEQLPEADGILYGEGERSFPALMRHYLLGAPLPLGCVYRDQTGEYRETAPQPAISMDEIPFIYRDLSVFENRIMYYETSRGCPFSCSYCLSSVDKRLRFRSLSLVFQELDFFLEKKVQQVKFVDRTFNCKRDHAMAIWNYIREHDNGVTNFHFEIAADLLGEEEILLIQSMRPGLIQLEIGVQSANPRTIQEIHRRMDLEKVKEVTNRIRQSQNVHQHLDLIAGLPYEDYESFGRSFDVVYHMQPSQLQLGFLKVLQGAHMYEQARAFGIRYQSEPPYEVMETPWLTHMDIIRLKRVEDAVERFYNSGQFTQTIRGLEAYFSGPFRMFAEIGEQYAAAGMHQKKHSREAIYEFLAGVIQRILYSRPELSEQRKKEEYTRFCQLLTMDYYLRENARKRPGFCKSQEGDKEKIREICERLFPDILYKDVLRDIHVELFWNEDTGTEQCWIFDYRKRDALTGNASLYNIPMQMDPMIK